MKKKTVLRLIFFLLAEIILLAVEGNAQSISPLYGEGGKGKVRGQFTVENPALNPIVVSVEAHAFSFGKDGGVVTRPLDSKTEVQIADASAKIGAKQKHQFDYLVKCETERCGIVFEASSYAGRTKDGMLIRIVLLHFVYVCEKGAKDCRAETRKMAGLGN